MTPSDPQAILIELMRQQYVNHWLYAVLAIVGAGIGSFASSYLRRRGDIQAVNDNFKAIRSQLSTTTRDTEEIKQHLSGRTWRSQQQWSARENYYSNLLDHLYRFKSTLESLFDYYLEPGSEHVPDREMGDRFPKLLAEASRAYAETRKLVGPAAIFLTPKATTSLESLFEAHWDLTTFSATCTHEYIEGASKMAEVAYAQVLLEAKQHLGITDEA